MSIDIGAQIKGIVQREVRYATGDPPVLETLYIRDVTLQVVGMPPEVQPVPTFVVPVTDATQWDQLQVGHTVTISIVVPA